MLTRQKGFGAIEVLVVIVIVGLISGLGWYSYNSRKNSSPSPSQSQQQNVSHDLVSSETKLSNGNTKLCSDEATLCFEYPSTWQRSKILHGSDFYGEKAFGGVEINPPTGAGLFFVKNDENTSTECRTGDECSITVKNLQQQENGNYILQATFNIKSQTNPEAYVADRNQAFFFFFFPTDVISYGLASGQTTQVKVFNPGVSFNKLLKVTFLVSPGKGFDQAAADNWLNSAEANAATAVLVSVTGV